MTIKPETLLSMEQDELNCYVWQRLRREGLLDPPLATRFGDEQPEEFLIQTERQSADEGFRGRLIGAVEDSIRRLVQQDLVAGTRGRLDAESDAQAGSLAYLISRIEGVELLTPVYKLAVSWFLESSAAPVALQDGQKHFLATLAEMPSHPELAPFWAELWDRAPRDVRGLVIHGWARSEPMAALGHLGGLADSLEEPVLGLVLWGLVQQDGPGLKAVSSSLCACTVTQQQKLRSAFRTVDPPQAMLDRFEGRPAANLFADDLYNLQPDRLTMFRVAA